MFSFFLSGKSLKDVNGAGNNIKKRNNGLKLNQSMRTIPKASYNEDDGDGDDGLVQNWSDIAEASSPRITTENKQQQQQNNKRKSKSLSRLDSVPKYIQREQAMDQAVSHTGLASVSLASTPEHGKESGKRERPLSESYYVDSDASSVLFEPITPISMQGSMFSIQNGSYNSNIVQSNDSIFDENSKTNKTMEDTVNTKSSPTAVAPSTKTKPKPSSPTTTTTPISPQAMMKPVNGFQAMSNSLDQILMTGDNNRNAPVVPPRSSKISSINSTQANNSPKIQNAIEPKFTTADSALTIKTPILKRYSSVILLN